MIRIHQCISGFTQRSNRRHGVFKLSEKLCRLHYNNRVSRVSLQPWNADWSDAAENMWQLSEEHNQPVACNIYAYSWGGGWGAIRLAEELGRRNIPVPFMVLSDAVFRHPNPLLRWTSLLRRDWTFSPAIRIPDNVATVIPFHQSINRPQGHKIVEGLNFSGIIEESRQIHVDHQHMDDAPMFHNAAIDAAAKLQEVTL